MLCNTGMCTGSAVYLRWSNWEKLGRDLVHFKPWIASWNLNMDNGGGGIKLLQTSWFPVNSAVFLWFCITLVLDTSILSSCRPQGVSCQSTCTTLKSFSQYRGSSDTVSKYRLIWEDVRGLWFMSSYTLIWRVFRSKHHSTFLMCLTYRLLMGDVFWKVFKRLKIWKDLSLVHVFLRADPMDSRL